jgi:hypothetical protein
MRRWIARTKFKIRVCLSKYDARFNKSKDVGKFVYSEEYGVGLLIDIWALNEASHHVYFYGEHRVIGVYPSSLTKVTFFNRRRLSVL